MLATGAAFSAADPIGAACVTGAAFCCVLTGAGAIATVRGWSAATAAIARGFVNGITLGGGADAFGIRAGGAGSEPRRTGVVNIGGAALTSTDVRSPS
ncbi:MAG: hypothetical protein JWP01_1987 [Myxococcales bacterium]|nr:hypothetical protein [Myxococcales bacterium]